MANQLRIAVKNVNLEIVAKILNPVARKYNCRVHYIQLEDRLNFVGDQNCFQHIIEEMITFFYQKPERVPVKAERHPRLEW